MIREREFGTAIGNGVAIPHLHLKELTNPILVYGRSLEGIDWDAPDGGPVHHIFFLATPMATADLHVQILASIARAMELPENRQDISSAANSVALLQVLSRILAAKAPKRHDTKISDRNTK